MVVGCCSRMLHLHIPCCSGTLLFYFMEAWRKSFIFVRMTKPLTHRKSKNIPLFNYHSSSQLNFLYYLFQFRSMADDVTWSPGWQFILQNIGLLCGWTILFLISMYEHELHNLIEGTV